MNILLAVPNLKSLEQAEKNKTIPPLYAFSNMGIKILEALTPPEHRVTVVDEVIGQTPDFAIRYDVVGITATTAQAPRACIIADEFRSRGAKVVMGGVHVSTSAEEALTHCDAVCIGEGEQVWPSILRDISDGQLKSVYKADTLIDMDTIPSVAVMKNRKGIAQNFLQTTRGCPYRCNFCSVNKLYGDKFRMMSVERVVEEVRLLKSKKMLFHNVLFFTDDNIVGNPSYAKELFRALKPLKIKWVSQASVNIAEDEELLDLAKASGCIGLLLGLESVSKTSLAEANKTVAVKVDYDAAIKKIHRRNIFVFGMFIVGFDADTVETFDDIYDFVNRNNLCYATINLLTPFPDTEVCRRLEAEGRIVSKKWEDYDLVHALIEPKNITRREMQIHQCRITDKLNSLSSIFKRVFCGRVRVGISLLLNLSSRKLVRMADNKKSIAETADNFSDQT